MATDRLGLNDSQLFPHIELNSKKFRGLRDILHYKDDTFYIWNDNTSEILTLVIQDKIDRNSPYQVCQYNLKKKNYFGKNEFSFSDIIINRSTKFRYYIINNK